MRMRFDHFRHVNPYGHRKIVRYDFGGARSDGSGQNITIRWKGHYSKVAEGHFTRTFMVRTVKILF